MPRPAVAAVHDGYLLSKTLAHSKMGGRLMTQAMQQVIESQTGAIRPRYTFRRVEKTPGNWEVRAVVCGATNSWGQGCHCGEGEGLKACWQPCRQRTGAADRCCDACVTPAAPAAAPAPALRPADPGGGCARHLQLQGVPGGQLRGRLEEGPTL